MSKVDSGDVGSTVDPTAGCMETLSLIVDEPQTKKAKSLLSQEEETKNRFGATRCIL
jgi:hypothetical protein